MILVSVVGATEAAEVAPSLSGADAQLMDKIEATWGGLCDVYAEAYDVPRGWLQAMVFRESEGNPRAFRREPNGWTGVGLLQITYPGLKGARPVEIDGKMKWLGGRTDEELMAPSVNLEIGAKYTAEKIHALGKDFPRVCAAFNHGSVQASNENPWGMVSTGNHISREVAALNYWIMRYGKLREAPVSQDPVALIDLTDLARNEDDEARRDLA